MGISNIKFQISNIKSSGFTLIELLFTFSIFSILSTAGIASFVSYSRAEALNSAMYDISTMLGVAKSRASSQVIPVECGANQLAGYRVQMCGLTGSTCSTPDTYELRALCGPSPVLIQTKTLPKGIHLEQSHTTSSSFDFHILTGAVEGPGAVIIKGYSTAVKTIQVDSLGNISTLNTLPQTTPAPTSQPTVTPGS